MAGCGEVNLSVNGPAPSKLKEEAGEDALSGSTAAVPPECAICLQSCVHPVRLPCCHVFCFLCVKGASWHSKRCALCRQEIPEDFLERPVLLSLEELKAAAAGLSRGVGESRGDHAWYYEGRNGWWQYDERTSRELEEAFMKGRKSTEMLIAGFLYVADLENMVQYRRNEHSRRRKMKRDVVNIPKKGVAGLRLESEAVSVPVLPAAGSSTADRVSSADGSDSSGRSQSSSFGILLSLPPVRPQTLLGRHLNSPLSPTPSTLEQSFSQLLISRPAGGHVEEDEEPHTCESASGSSESEEEEEEEESDGRRRTQRALRESGYTRVPPRGMPSSSALSLRSRSPDGQCTVTEV
ncbi:E3 ubiquitin-protein ligase rnf146-like isoform 1-T1 [Fundulus diaphanus]